VVGDKFEGIDFVGGKWSGTASEKQRSLDLNFTLGLALVKAHRNWTFRIVGGSYNEARWRPSE
jgi:hypothetical protein